MTRPSSRRRCRGRWSHPRTGRRPGQADRRHRSRRNEALLVLDTCEHVRGRSGPARATVLRTAPGRARPRARADARSASTGEFAWPVPPLDLPPPDAVAAEEITVARRGPAVHRAGPAVRPDLDVDDPPPPTSPPSASRSMACRWPSSWPPPAPTCSARRPFASRLAGPLRAARRRRRRTPPNGSRRCAPPSTGASSC